MQVFHTISDVREFCAKARSAATVDTAATVGSAATVGLVPTMGALHDGHASLVRAARADNDIVVASVFVNPLQFTDLGDCDDYRNYPRNLEQDAEFLRSLGVDAVFAPSVDEMYPGFSAYPDQHPQIWVRTGRMGEILEGASRPGHFDGVATVVAKLFQIIQPDRAYFGRKDAQQLAIIQAMVRDLDIPVTIHGLPIVRGVDGVAESSRNLRLSAPQRHAAQALSRTLFGLRDGEFTSVEAARDHLASCTGVELDYFRVVDPADLRDVPADTRPALALTAAWVGPVRLIDNLALEAHE